MVNIRATLARAVSTGVIDDTTASTLERLGKGLFYAERWYARILELAREEGAAAAILDDFGRWLRSGAVNQKRDDAVAMLQEMRVCLDRAPNRTGRFRVRGDALVATAEGERCGDWPGARRRLVLETLARDRAAWDRAMAGALAGSSPGRTPNGPDGPAKR